jgi:hypothetical protein
MFGKRSNDGSGKPPLAPKATPAAAVEAHAASTAPDVAASVAPSPVSAPAAEAAPAPAPMPQAPAPRRDEPPAKRRSTRNEAYYDTKSQVFSALIDTIDLSQLAKLDAESAREEIRDIVNDIITIKNFALSIAEQESCSTTSATMFSATARSSRCWRATTSPTSWSTAPTRSTSKSPARSSRPIAQVSRRPASF